MMRRPALLPLAKTFHVPSLELGRWEIWLRLVQLGFLLWGAVTGGKILAHLVTKSCSLLLDMLS